MQEKHEQKYCGRCFVLFTYKVGNILTCQCSKAELSKPTKDFLLETSYDCLCANCMSELNTLVNSNLHRISPNPSHLIERLHFYKEGGYFVFTELYHFLKGQCCGNKCRHCAYGNKKQTNGTTGTN
jgi:Family of unknown function (DUF5522)